jgi:flagellar protein FlaG
MSDSFVNGVGGSLQGVQAASSLKLVKYAESSADKAAADVNDKAALSGAVKKLNEYVAPALQTIEFSIDDESDRIIVKVVDTETQKVLRQIPNEEVLAISKTLDKLRGLVVRQTA